MKNSESSQAGGAKKFLYTGAKREQEEQEELPWNFNSKNSSPRANQGQVTGKTNFGMDDVWSIKRNVNIGNKAQKQADEKLTYNTDKSYYSRYRGGGKDKDEFDSAFGGGSSSNTDSKSWNAGGQGRRPFSYSFGSEPVQPVSPRNTSNSSSGMYPQSGQQQQQQTSFNIQTGSGMSSGNPGNLNLNSNSNINSFPGRNLNSNADSTFSSGGGFGGSSGGGGGGGGGGGSLFNKSLSKSVSQNDNSRNYNAMFGQTSSLTNNPSQNRRDGGSMFNRQNNLFR